MNLTQRRSLTGSTQFDLTDHLRVRERSLFRTVEAEFDLGRISPKPLHLREVPVRWVIAAGAFTLLATFAVIDGWLTKDMGTTFGFLLVAGCAAACWFNVWQLYRNVLVFRDRNTNQTAFVLLRSSPSTQAVDQFVQQIATMAESPRPPLGTSKAEAAAHHAKVLHYLLEAGVLLPEEHTAILRRMSESLPKGAVVALVPREA